MATKRHRISWKVSIATQEGSSTDDGHADWKTVFETTDTAKAVRTLWKVSRKYPGVLCGISGELRTAVQAAR